MLKFNIRNQTISRADTFRPAEKSIGYLLASFDFKTSDWHGYTKTAVFKNLSSDEIYDRILDEDICLVPWEAISTSGKCEVSVYGLKDGSRITTDKTEFCLNQTLYGGSATKEPTPTVYEQLLERVANIDGGTFEDWKEG